MSVHSVVVVITTPLPPDGGTARTAIQVHTVNLIEIRLGQWFPTRGPGKACWGSASALKFDKINQQYSINFMLM